MVLFCFWFGLLKWIYVFEHVKKKMFDADIEKEKKRKIKSDLSPAARYCDLQLDLDRISTSNLIWNLMWILLFEPAQPGILELNHARIKNMLSYTRI